MRSGTSGVGLWLGAAAVVATGASFLGGGAPEVAVAASPPAACDTAGLSLPPGFCATVFADNLGHVRHLAVRADGTVFANTWSGRYFPNSPPPPGGFFVALRDANHDGRAEIVTRFGPAPGGPDKAAGGSGVALYEGRVYFELNDRIVRYPLPADALAPTVDPETVLSGLPTTGDHNMHPFVISARGELYVDLGSATNSCQPRNRQAEAPGAQPCTELETRGGIWKYDADRLGQVFSPKERFATGLRNGEGLAWDAQGRFYATMHGRDQLAQNWSKLYANDVQTLELPSEELVELKAGGDYGWPFCYYDGVQKGLVLAPEYGGDGGKAVGLCAQKSAPVAAFPSHWGPNDLVIYNGRALPPAWRGGAFVVFHGSWNRAPAPQDGYNVVFQPLANGRASGPWLLFADGFAGTKDPGKAEFRPTGIAVAPDGALFISDDVKGRIWRVTYRGAANAPAVAAAAAALRAAPTTAAAAGPPPFTRGARAVTASDVAAGERIYRASTCTGCHGADGAGTPLGPSLVAGPWLWGGSLPQVTASIEKGVPEPKAYRSPMPAMGGASLSPAELKSVSAYVWSIGRAKTG